MAEEKPEKGDEVVFSRKTKGQDAGKSGVVKGSRDGMFVGKYYDVDTGKRVVRGVDGQHLVRRDKKGKKK